MWTLALLTMAGCGSSDGGMSPSDLPQVIQGSIGIGGFLDVVVVQFQVTRGGRLSGSVDWTNAANDIDTALAPRGCTLEQILAEEAGCDEPSALDIDDSLDKPSVLNAQVSPGTHTLVIINFGNVADTCTYRFEVS